MKTEVITISIAILVGVSLAAGYGVGDATHRIETLTSTATETTTMTSTVTGPTITSTSTSASVLTTTMLQISTITNTVTTTQTLQINCQPTTTETASTNEPLWTYPTNGTITSIAVSGDGQYVAAGVEYGGTSGAVLLFDGCGDLLWQYQTHEMISHIAISEDGSHILANGLQILPTPPGTLGKEGNSETYGFDSNGSLVWTRPFSTETMSADGSQVAVVGSNFSLALLTWQGQTLWNDSFPVAEAHIAFQNGSLLVDGPQGITMLGPGGNVSWTTQTADNFWTAALTPDGYLVAASYDAGDNNAGTVMLFSGNGTLLWEHSSEGGADSAAVLPDGSSIAYTAAWNRVLFFSGNGTLLGNLTSASGYPSILATSRDMFLLGGGRDNGLSLFNSTGGQVWSYALNETDAMAVSGDGNFVAASNGTGISVDGQWSPSTLYFFNISTAAVGANPRT